MDAMNKVVLEHYPASRLPDDIRGDLPKEALVRVVVEAEEKSSTDSRSPFASLSPKSAQSANLKALLRDRRSHPDRYAGNATTEEIVARIRELRNEWDDR